MKPGPVAVDLLRHGEPEGGRRYRGGQDDPLSDRGWRQMEAAVAGAGPWERIVTSPLRRCSEFARGLGERLSIPVSEDPRLREIGFGAWEGRSAAELLAADPGALRRFYHDPLGAAPEGAEPVPVFMARVARAWEDCLAESGGERLLIVSHAGVMRAIVAHLLGMPPERLFRIAIGHAVLLRIRGDGERPPALRLE
ncbi:MAG TPA: histidine phosphatase family protein [Gammaproteobacteria bacterium]|nr:histidine phosphatase family protein [Gammaproteobacteria bacterium]